MDATTANVTERRDEPVLQPQRRICVDEIARAYDRHMEDTIAFLSQPDRILHRDWANFVDKQNGIFSDVLGTQMLEFHQYNWLDTLAAVRAVVERHATHELIPATYPAIDLSRVNRLPTRYRQSGLVTVIPVRFDPATEQPMANVEALEAGQYGRCVAVQFGGDMAFPHVRLDFLMVGYAGFGVNKTQRGLRLMRIDDVAEHTWQYISSINDCVPSSPPPLGSEDIICVDYYYQLEPLHASHGLK